MFSLAGRYIYHLQGWVGWPFQWSTTHKIVNHYYRKMIIWQHTDILLLFHVTVLLTQAAAYSFSLTWEWVTMSNREGKMESLLEQGSSNHHTRGQQRNWKPFYTLTFGNIPINNARFDLKAEWWVGCDLRISSVGACPISSRTKTITGKTISYIKQTSKYHQID